MKDSGDDGRMGLLSASEADACNECRGRKRLIAQLPSGQIVPSSSAARSGTRIAQYLAGESVELTPEEMTTAMMCKEDEGAAVLEWGANKELFLSREKRYFLRDRMVPIMSAKPDCLYIYRQNSALILNHKTGRLEPEASPRNLQLRAEAVCVHSQYPELESITVGIVQPWVRRKPDLVLYDSGDLARAREQFFGLVRAISQSDAPLAINEYCKWCPAVSICPLIRQTIWDLGPAINGNALTLSAAVAVLSAPEKLELFHRIKMLEPAFRQIIATLAIEVEREPDAIPGLKLKKGSTIRKITDSGGAANILKSLVAVTDEEIESTKSMAVTRLEELYGNKRHLAGKSLKQEFNRAFDPVLDFIQEKPTLTEN